MNRIIFILIFLSFPIIGFATAQVGDRLIWNGDTLQIFANPLELRKDIESLKPKLFGENEPGWSTGCWRGYIAEWTLIENEIYLTNIFCCFYYIDSIKSDLQNVFGSAYVNGKVKATWITGEILIPKGRIIHYVHDGYESFYEKEVVLTFKDGTLIHHNTYDNSMSYKSIFNENPDSLLSFIYSNINWEIIPLLKQDKAKVFILILSGEKIKPDSVAIIRGAENDIINQETLRVIKLLPEWDAYYRRGEVYRKSIIFPVTFNDDLRREFTH